MLTPVSDYAAGSLVTSRVWAGGAVYTHVGSNTLWWAVACVAPGIDRAFLAVANSATSATATNQAIAALLVLDG